MTAPSAMLQPCRGSFEPSPPTLGASRLHHPGSPAAIPLLAQGTWLPFCHFFGHSGSTFIVTGGALLIGLAGGLGIHPLLFGGILFQLPQMETSFRMELGIFQTLLTVGLCSWLVLRRDPRLSPIA